MQKPIHAETKEHFDTLLRQALAEGCKVVPNTYHASSYSSLGWNAGSQKNDAPIVIHDFFIIVEEQENKGKK
jgi:hypothetical protein